MSKVYKDVTLVDDVDFEEVRSQNIKFVQDNKEHLDNKYKNILNKYKNRINVLSYDDHHDI